MSETNFKIKYTVDIFFFFNTKIIFTFPPKEILQLKIQALFRIDTYRVHGNVQKNHSSLKNQYNYFSAKNPKKNTYLLSLL